MASELFIEDIILKRDRRGISALRKFLPSDFCKQAAKYILDCRRDNQGTVFITTGFYILAGKTTETDGPPGAIALSNALNKLGFDVIFVTDKHSLPFFTPDLVGQAKVVEFPITGSIESRCFADDLLNKAKPDVIISTERCGACPDGKYLNMVCRDISDFTAKVDYLFRPGERTVGIGDGGNEIGMGNLAAEVARCPTLTPQPPATCVDRLIIASVSNWGAYGLIAALSLLNNRNLLPEVDWEKNIIREIVKRGAVDGVSGENKPTVDSFDLEQNAQTLEALNKSVIDHLK
jgi:hypothetical protein